MHRRGSLAVVTLPAEIDIVNDRQVDEELNSLLGAQRAAVLVADLTATRFCDSAGVAALVRAWKRASTLGIGLRVVVPAGGQVLRILQVLGADRILDVYSSLEEALAEEPRAS